MGAIQGQVSRMVYTKIEFNVCLLQMKFLIAGFSWKWYQPHDSNWYHPEVLNGKAFCQLLGAVAALVFSMSYQADTSKLLILPYQPRNSMNCNATYHALLRIVFTNFNLSYMLHMYFVVYCIHFKSIEH